MPDYLSPRVYVEVPSAVKPIAGVGTSTAGSSASLRRIRYPSQNRVSNTTRSVSTSKRNRSSRTTTGEHSGGNHLHSTKPLVRIKPRPALPRRPRAELIPEHLILLLKFPSVCRERLSPVDDWNGSHRLHIEREPQHAPSILAQFLHISPGWTADAMPSNPTYGAESELIDSGAKGYGRSVAIHHCCGFRRHGRGFPLVESVE